MVKKTIISLVLYFLKFYLTSLRGKEYFAKNQELEPVAAQKKNTGSRSRLGKKIRSWSR